MIYNPPRIGILCLELGDDAANSRQRYLAEELGYLGVLVAHLDRLANECLHWTMASVKASSDSGR